MITLRCPSCGETYYAEDTSIGRYIKCTGKGCNTLIEVKVQKAAPSKKGAPSGQGPRAAWASLLKNPWKRVSFTRKKTKQIALWAALVIACAALTGAAGMAAPLLLASVVGWHYARTKKGLWFPTVASALRAIAYGLAAALILIFILTDYERIAPTRYPTVFQNIGDGLVGLIIMLNGLIDSCTIYVFAIVLGIFVVLHRFAPVWNPLKQFVTLLARVSSVALVFVSLVSFAFFGQERIDGLTAKAENQLTTRHLDATRLEREYQHKSLLAQSMAATLNLSNGVGVKDKRYFQDLFGRLGGEPAMVRDMRRSAALKAADEDAGKALEQAQITEPSVTPAPIEPIWNWTINKWFSERDATTKQEERVEALRFDTNKSLDAVQSLLCEVSDLNLYESKTIIRPYLEAVLDKYAGVIPDTITPDQLHTLSHLTFSPMMVRDMEAKALESRLAGARGLMKASSWKDAIDKLTALHDEYPDTQAGQEAAALVPECHFLNAEQDFAERDYDAAAEQYDAVASKFPNSPRVPEARRRGISAEVMVIKAGKYEHIDPATVLGPSGISGSSVVDIKNNTGYHLTVLYDGPDPQIALLDPGAFGSITLKSGNYAVATSVDLYGVTPKWGERRFDDVHVREVFETK